MKNMTSIAEPIIHWNHINPSPHGEVIGNEIFVTTKSNIIKGYVGNCVGPIAFYTGNLYPTDPFQLGPSKYHFH